MKCNIQKRELIFVKECYLERMLNGIYNHGISPVPGGDADVKLACKAVSTSGTIYTNTKYEMFDKIWEPQGADVEESCIFSPSGQEIYRKTEFF